MGSFLSTAIATNANGLTAPTCALALALIGLVIMLLRLKRTSWVMASFLIGSLAGLPIVVWQFSHREQFEPVKGTLFGWLLQVFGLWVATWIPYGALGLGCGWLVKKIVAKNQSRLSPEAQSSPRVLDNSREILAVRLMLGFSAVIWLLAGVAYLLRHSK